MPRLISRAEFARLAGVSKPAVTKALKGPLRGACQRDRVDIDQADAAAYLSAKNPQWSAAYAKQAPPAVETDGAPTRVAKKTSRAPSAPTSPAKAARKVVAAPTADHPAPTDPPVAKPKGTDIELAGYAARLRPLVRVFGPERGFRDWLLALKEIEAISKARLDNGERAGRLVTRAFVQTHVFGALDGMMRLLLTDSSKTIARRAYAMAKSGSTAEEGEAMVREIISSQLVRVRDDIIKALEQTHRQAVQDAIAAAAQDAVVSAIGSGDDE